MPPAPIFSGGRHLSVQVELVTSSTVRRMGSLVGAAREEEELINALIPSVNGMGGRLSSLKMSSV